MTLDFKPLPMSELRRHPGEILDRVAIGGESFVIERNGRQKACLVPLSVFLPDITPARIAHELKQSVVAGNRSPCVRIWAVSTPARPCHEPTGNWLIFLRRQFGP
jgi:prevent-host-death family protein